MYKKETNNFYLDAVKVEFLGKKVVKIQIREIIHRKVIKIL